jgi:hypothetical protein
MPESHSSEGKLPNGRPFASGHDPRRNLGGRPHGLAKLAREAVGDGRDLIDFYLAVFRGDSKTLGLRRITLRDRLAAAAWLGERGWGKAPLVADPDLSTEPQVNFYDALGAWARSLPPELRKVVGEVMDRQFIEGIEADIAEVEAEVAATMPEGRSPSRPAQPPDGQTKLPK